MVRPMFVAILRWTPKVKKHKTIRPQYLSRITELNNVLYKYITYMARILKGKVIPLQARCGPEGG